MVSLDGCAFDRVAADYRGKSLAQAAAADRLLGMLRPGPDEDVLDVGCGPGHVTGSIARKTLGRVVGVDISPGMIEQAKKENPGVEFRRLAAEDLDYNGEFDIVFSNSTLQWFEDGPRAVGGMRAALREGGRLGVCCPSTPEFAPWFNRVVEAVVSRPEIAPVYAHRSSPWFHLPDLQAYVRFFEERGFRTEHAAIEYEATRYAVDEAFGIFTAGPAQGFIGSQYYDIEQPPGYRERFCAAVREEMEAAAAGGSVVVDFNRLYYIAGAGG